MWCRVQFDQCESICEAREFVFDHGKVQSRQDGLSRKRCGDTLKSVRLDLSALADADTENGKLKVSEGV